MMFFIMPSKLCAIDYNASIESVENLVYGDKYSEGVINGESSIPGNFKFKNNNDVVNFVGINNVEVVFVPDDSNYSLKTFNVDTDIKQRRISIVFKAPIYKQHDGLATIDLPDYTYSGILNDEVSVEGELVGELSATYPGEGIAINLSGVSIKGDKKDYYYIDLLNHNARIYPSKLEHFGDNATVIALDKDVYVDIGYSLKVEEVTSQETIINDLYTSFVKYTYNVYNHYGNELKIDSKYKVLMKIEETYLNKERLYAFELTEDGEYKDLEYTYSDGNIIFTIDSGSSFVLATRNIEYRFIIMFSSILLFSVVFIIVYTIRNSKIKSGKEY